VENGVPVVLFILDQTLPDFAPSVDLLLRAFFVDASAQGRDVARRCLGWSGSTSPRRARSC
jgi:hypothetical protein